MKKRAFNIRLFVIVLLISLLMNFSLLASPLGHEQKNPSMKITYSYQSARTKEYIEKTHVGVFKSTPSSDASDTESNYYSNPLIEKTLYLVDIAKKLKKYTQDYWDCVTSFDDGLRNSINHNTTSLSLTPLNQMVDPVTSEIIEKRLKISQNLKNSSQKFKEKFNSKFELWKDKKVIEVLDLMDLLAKNMEQINNLHAKKPIELQNSGLPHILTMNAKSFDVTAGGAQDFTRFKTNVKNGHIPASSTLTIEGFLSEFKLSLDSTEDNTSQCLDLICVQPITAFLPKQHRLYVQLDMQTAINDLNFNRLPLNLAVVLDISGSMRTFDDTTKSRLDHSKEALRHTIRQLTPEDRLSLIVFDSTSEIIHQSEPVTDKDSLIERINQLETKGTTNLEAGLRDGYESILKFVKDGFENRVIMITDAGLNTGVTDDNQILNLVTSFSEKGIGLTAIGLGSNFNQKLISTITNSPGGNYIFAQDGVKMYEYFENFNFLVSPIAHHFKLKIKFEPTDQKLLATYGAPENQIKNNEILIHSLFLSQTGGGTVLLEYLAP